MASVLAAQGDSQVAPGGALGVFHGEGGGVGGGGGALLTAIAPQPPGDLLGVLGGLLL